MSNIRGVVKTPCNVFNTNQDRVPTGVYVNTVAVTDYVFRNGLLTFPFRLVEGDMVEITVLDPPIRYRGNTLLAGPGAPTEETGYDGDCYIDTLNMVFYGPKGFGAWTTGGVSMKGPIGEPGLTGMPGLAGENGLPGLPGVPGERGPQGLPGKDGIIGKDGAAGAKGDKGDQGERGLQGIQGVAGERGLQGIQGVQGPAGQNASASSGQVAFFASDAIPSGWLLCNGSAVSRAAHPGLFAVIGTKYGAGDTTTTFTLPDLRGEFIRAADVGRGLDSGRGVGTIQGQSFQSHSHVLGNDPGVRVMGGWEPYFQNGQAQASPVTAWRTANEGGAETRPRNYSLLACIKI